MPVVASGQGLNSREAWSRAVHRVVGDGVPEGLEVGTWQRDCP